MCAASSASIATRAQLFDARRGEPLSPYYHPTRARGAEPHALREGRGRKRPARSARAARLSSSKAKLEPLARSVASVIPNGYLSGVMAKAACERAGKRLCTHAEWLTACRGQRGRAYPYGDRYAEGLCNVFRETHPAAALHGDPSRHHLDPRLNRSATREARCCGRPGTLPRCRSEWGNDAVYDMVGNLDEWAARAGAFHGGFYARATREGCDARISVASRRNTSTTASAAAAAAEVAVGPKPAGWNPQISRFLVPDVGFYLTI